MAAPAGRPYNRGMTLGLSLAVALSSGVGLEAEARAEVEVHQPCPRLKFIGPEVKLTDVEKRLICGDASRPGWQDVPMSQARGFLEAVLQKSGRYFPAFGAEGDALTVRIGTVTYISGIASTGIDGLFDLSKRRGIVGFPLTPSELDKVKAAAVFELQTRGFACPVVDVTADASTGRVSVAARPGKVLDVEEIVPSPVPGVDPAVFRRYQAFETGKPFDIRLMTLTADRVKSEPLFLSAYYDVACSTAGAVVTQRVMRAPPHYLAIGGGVDTEGYIRGRAQMKESLLGHRASSVEATVFASAREVSLDSDAKLYPSSSSRGYLYPHAYISRLNESQFQAEEALFFAGPAYGWDDQSLHVETQAGPAVEYFNTIAGIGPTQDAFFGFDTKTEVTSHLFEFYRRDPRSGWSLGFETQSRVKGAYSSVSADRMLLSHEKLWNPGNYDPPFLVVGLRGFAGTIWAGDRPSAFTDVPPDLRFFLGGDADLRGAARKGLPGDDLGFLTAVYEGLELRLVDVLPQGLQPLAFVDGAMGSQRDFHVERDVYWSPGVGLRWASPVGSIRATVARGLVWSRGGPVADSGLPHWHFFFSFGQEF